MAKTCPQRLIDTSNSGEADSGFSVTAHHPDEQILKKKHDRSLIDSSQAGVGFSARGSGAQLGHGIQFRFVKCIQ